MRISVMFFTILDCVLNTAMLAFFNYKESLWGWNQSVMNSYALKMSVFLVLGAPIHSMVSQFIAKFSSYLWES